MPKRGTLLTDYEKGTIDALLEEKKPVKEIATQLVRSYKCLYNHSVYELSVRTKRRILTIDALLEEKKPVKEIATRLVRSYKCLYNDINTNVCITCLVGVL